MPKRTIAVIDGNSLLHRAFHAVQGQMSAPDGTPTNAAFGFMQMLLKLVEDHRPDGIVCAWDTHRPEWRMKLLERYKAQRPPMDPSLSVQFPLVEGLLESLNIPNVKLDGYEGDDILGTFAALGEEQDIRIFLITGDKDAYQLASETTTIVTTKKGMSDIVLYTPERVEERYGIPPALVPDFLGLKGDSSDNIPGVPGVGEKTAAKLLSEYGSLEGIYEHADEISGKLGEKVRSHEDDARISKQVATIRRDAPVDVRLQDVNFPDFDAQKAIEAFGALHFNRHLRQVLALLGDDAQGGVAEPRVKLSFHVAKDAEAFVEAALNADRCIAVALDGEEEGRLFGDGEMLFFSDGAGLATCSLDDSRAIVGQILARGCLVAFDAKSLLRHLFEGGPLDAADPAAPDAAADPAASAALDVSRLDSERIFDCSLAGYLLDSSKPQNLDELSERYLGVMRPQGEGSPSDGAFEAACVAALVEPLREALDADGSLRVFTDIDMPLLPVLLRMELYGVAIDAATLSSLSETISGQLKALTNEIHALAGEEFNIDSPMQLGHILFDVVGLDTKKSKKNRRGWSTNAAVLEKLADDHPLPAKVIEYRELAKLKSTYLDALPALVDDRDGRIHTTFNQTVASTGRLSSSDPNLQNIPVRSDLGRQIRTAFTAPEGGVFLSADYSQIELRVLAHLSGDVGLIAAFKEGEDFHAETAARVFGVAVGEVTPEMRSKAKAVNFGIVYGQQAFGLGQSLHIPLDQAQEMIDRYYAAYPGVRAYLDRTVDAARESGYAETMFGRKRHIPELASGNANVRHFGERTAMNHPMQGSAADIIKLAMVEVDRRMRREGLSAHMVIQVHDELDFECPSDEVDALSALVKDAMEGVVELAVPLTADVGIGANWARAH